MYYLTRQIAFEASHFYRIPSLSDAENRELYGAAANPNSHGHNYVLEATIKGRVRPEHGMVVNITDLDRILRAQIVSAYDHKHINIQHPDFVNNPALQPTCENLVIQMWNTIAQHLEDGEIHQMRLHEDSTLFADYFGEGQMVYLTKVYEFSAAHRLHSLNLSDEENRALFGKCNNLHGHGHNYVLEVTVKGEVDPVTGMVARLNLLDDVMLKQVYERFDHKHLNLDTPEFKELNPTSEVFVKVLWDILEPSLEPVKLHRLRLKETPRSYFDYYGEANPNNEHLSA